ncbi:MAG TPA: 2-hydroxyacid dehydrogenase [Stellaceae bacterium]|nr:2-hydroxyacid dehydrogenase [Stellaceae bacterium]
MTAAKAIAILDAMEHPANTPSANTPTVVLFGYNAADRADALRPLLASAWRIVKVPEGADRAMVTAAFAEADAIFTHRFDSELPPAPRLKLLQVPGAGYDPIDLAALPAGCSVCNVHEHETGIAEYVLLGMLEWTIGMAGMDRQLRRRDWTGSALKGPFHGELAGKSLGIIGFGHIGREVAIRARAFGMRIGAITRTPRQSELVDWVVPMSELDARLTDCDFVLIACPLTAETRGLIDARRLELMKRSVVLINVARGDIVVEDSLYTALKDKIIAGAVLDTWYVYPSSADPDPYPSRLPFHELANVIMTPHASGWTDKLLDRRWRVMAENLDRLAAGQALRNVVHRG